MKRTITIQGFGQLGWGLFAATALIILAAAARTDSPRVAVVDPNRIRLESKTITQGLLDASGPAQAVQKDLKAKNDELLKALETYQAQQDVANEETNRQRAAQIETLKREVDALAQAFDKAMSDGARQGVGPMRDRIFAVVAEVARERSIDVVITTDGVLYHAPAAELTDLVIERLDALATE